MAETDRYTVQNILRAERMYGRGYQSPGQAADEPDALRRSLDEELARRAAARDAFLGSFSADDYRYLTERWANKVDVCRRAELASGWFLARCR